MSDTGSTITRPKTPQDQTKIAAGSPIAIQGIFLEIIRERFKVGSGLAWTWNEDPTRTDILIEASFSEETEARNVTPAVYVTRQQTIPGKVVLGDRKSVRLRDHLEGFTCLVTTAMQLECVSNDEGESGILGDIVQFMLICSSDIIQREFGMHDLTHAVLGATTPYSRDVNKYSTPIEFQVQYWVTWSTVPIRPLLQQIVQRVTASGVDSNTYFSNIALQSTQRADSND